VARTTFPDDATYHATSTSTLRVVAAGGGVFEGGFALLEVEPVTGRTHQIRVHLAALGHPVAGDPVYGTGTSRRGPEGLERLFLHAWRLVFASPATGDLVRLEAQLPAALEAALAGLRATAPGAPPRPLAADESEYER
jgi:23S rRNA pseudouridine1911/1915/1917 synthase